MSALSGPLGRRGRSAGGVCAARCLTRLGRQPCGTKGGSRSAPSGRDVGPTRGTVTSRARPGEPHRGTCSRVAAVSAGAWRARWAGAGGAPTDGVRAGVRICRWAGGSSGLASQTAGALRARATRRVGSAAGSSRWHMGSRRGADSPWPAVLYHPCLQAPCATHRVQTSATGSVPTRARGRPGGGPAPRGRKGSPTGLSTCLQPRPASRRQWL